MSVINSLKNYIESFGTTVSLSADGKSFGTPYRAFIQPLRYKNKMYLMGIRSRVGWIDQSHYLYIGPAERDVAGLSSAARIKCKNENFYIVKAENVRLGEDIFYNWAVIRAVVEEPSVQSAAQSTTQSTTQSAALSDTQSAAPTATQSDAQSEAQSAAPTAAQSDAQSDAQAIGRQKEGE